MTAFVEPEDVACPREKCQSEIGVWCRSPQGSTLTPGGRTLRGRHPERWGERDRYQAWLGSASQGMLKSALRDEQRQIRSLQDSLHHEQTVAGRAELERLLKARRNRYSAIWTRLEVENRPVVKRFKRPEPKRDVPHPELIVCPVCEAAIGTPCHKNKVGLAAYHLARIRRSP